MFRFNHSSIRNLWSNVTKFNIVIHVTHYCLFKSLILLICFEKKGLQSPGFEPALVQTEAETSRHFLSKFGSLKCFLQILA